MKIGIFTDSHYSSQETTCNGERFNSKSLEKIKLAYEFFKKEKCELIVCLGDLIDKEAEHRKEIENLKSVAEVFASCKIPTVCVMGNHDGFAFERRDFYDVLGGCDDEIIQKEGKTLLFLDTCYFKSGIHYAPGDTDWKDTFYPFQNELEAKLKSLKGEVYIFMHQNIDGKVPQDHCLYNAESMRNIIINSGVVKTVFQGHFHKGATNEYNGVKFITLPAMCEGDDRYFTFEI